MKTTFTKVATGWRWEIDDDDATFSGVRPTKVEAHAEALACWSGVLYAEVNRDSPAPEPQPDWRARAEAADHDRDDMERERDAARACAADLADLRDAATARAEAAEQRAEAVVADAQAAAHFCQSVAHLLASPGAEAEAVQHLRAADLPHLFDCLRERLAKAQAEGFAAGINAAADALAWQAEAFAGFGHYGYAHEMREARKAVLETLAEAQPAEVTDV